VTGIQPKKKKKKKNGSYIETELKMRTSQCRSHKLI
jgi:hypothetical protein